MTNTYAGPQTEKNVQEAFAGESQARNKYTYFASLVNLKCLQYPFLCLDPYPELHSR